MKTKAIIENIWILLFIIVAGVFFFRVTGDGDEQEVEQALIPTVNYWQVFATITKERRYIEEAGAHYRMPVFPPELLDLSGKEIIIRGYFLPYSKLDSIIIISRYPNASCFYCGFAGIESVAMVKMDEKDPLFKTDQRLTVKGKLTLNSTDVQKLAFVIEEALVE